MKTIMETFVSVLILLVSCLLFSSILLIFVQVNNARNFHSQIVECMENSDYSEDVMTTLKTESSAKGYLLEMEQHQTKNGNSCYYVSLKYTISFPVFALIHQPLTKEGVITGYAGI